MTANCANLGEFILLNFKLAQFENYAELAVVRVRSKIKKYYRKEL